jgi:hypothetical protein
VRHRTVDVNLVQLGFQALAQTFAQPQKLLGFLRHFLLTKLRGLAESHDAGHIQRAGTHAALVPAAINDGRKLHARIATPHIQCANALGAIKLVG